MLSRLSQQFFSVLDARFALFPDVAIHLLLHFPSHLKLHDTLGWDVDKFLSPGVCCRSRFLCTWFEHAKVSQFQAVVLCKFMCDLLCQLLHNRLDSGWSEMKGLRDSIDKFLFGDRGHVSDSLQADIVQDCDLSHRLTHIHNHTSIIPGMSSQGSHPQRVYQQC